MIKNISLKNFMAFQNLNLDFSRGVNVIVGDSGTGKTQLLKAADILWDGCLINKNRKKPEHIIENLLIQMFHPLDKEIRNLIHGDETQAKLSITLENGGKFAFSISRGAKERLKVLSRPKSRPHVTESVLIPSIEILLFMEGLRELCDALVLNLDCSYFRLIGKLFRPVVRKESLNKCSQEILDVISNQFDGKFVFEIGEVVKYQIRGKDFSINSAAEGHRKLGMLHRLIETGALVPGKSGPLFWDEPEANLNPKIIYTLVKIVIEMIQEGQQAIITTHDYVVFKWFELLKGKLETDSALFINLIKNPKSSVIESTSGANFNEITPNLIDEAYEDIIDFYMNQNRGNFQ